LIKFAFKLICSKIRKRLNLRNKHKFMVSQELLNYIKQQLALGKTEAEITPVLLNAKWAPEDVKQAFQGLSGGNTTNLEMPASATRSELPPIGTLFSEAWELMKLRVGVMFLSGLALLGILLGCVIVAGVIVFVVFKTAGTTVGIITGIILGVIAFISYIYSIFWSIAAQLTALRDADENTGVKENIMRARPLIGKLFLVSLLTVLAIIGGYILLIIPGIILAMRYSFSKFIVVAEEKDGRLAIAQSNAYVKGRTGKVFLRILSVYAVFYIPIIIINIVVNTSNNQGIAILGGIILFLLQIIFTLYLLPFFYTLYKHLKTTSGPTEPQKYIGAITGWAIWGVVAWIILLVGIGGTAYYLNSKNAINRDLKRRADIKQIEVGLQLYYNDRNQYPQSLSQLVPGYLPSQPVTPKPTDGPCTTQQNDYTYITTNNFQNYKLSFCLGQDKDGYSQGPLTSSSHNQASSTPTSDHQLPTN
jgi:hypothetical protein